MKQQRPLAILLVLAIYSQALAQQPATPPPAPEPPATQTSAIADREDTLRISTNLVQLDFVVTDKRGNQVTDLRTEDIEIFEDGRSQQISNFAYIPTGPAAPTTAESKADSLAAKSSVPSPATPARRENVRRTIAIVFDDLGMSFPRVGPAQSALRKFVTEQVQPGDLVAIIRTGGEVGALQQFTKDKRQLLAAVDRLRWNNCSRGGLYITRPLTQNVLARRLGMGGGGIEYAGELPACSQSSLDATFQSIRFIIGGMRELPGRKSVIILSDTIPVEADEQLTGTASPLNFNNASYAGAPSDRRNYSDPLRRISELAIRSSVVIYGIDTRGLPALNISAADQVAGLSGPQIHEVMGGPITSAVASGRHGDMIGGRAGMESLANETGGLTVKNNNDISLGLGRIMNDLQGYYLVGYRPTSETFNRRFHKIKARVRNRPDLIVRTRTGFFGLAEEEELRPRASTAADRFLVALTSPFAAGDLDVQLTPSFTNTSSAGSLLRTMLHIDTRGLTFKPEAKGWESTDLVLRGVLFGDNGKIVTEHRHQFTLRLRGGTLQRVRSKGLDYVFNMPVKKPGAYQFRIAVLDPISGRIGSAGQFVEVPDLKKRRLTLSGLIVRGLIPAAGLPARPFTMAGDSDSEQQDVATPAVRRFNQHMLLDYTYVVFNARYDKSTSRPDLKVRTQIFRDGQSVYDQEAPVEAGVQTDSVRAVAGGRLQLGQEFGPGDYVLQLTITDPLAPKDHRTATQWIDFEIVK